MLEALRSEINAYRSYLDTLLANLRTRLVSSREVSLAYTHCQRAFHATGRALGKTGTPTPYTNSSDPSNKIIDPLRVERKEAIINEFSEIEQLPTQTERVKALRKIMDVLLANLEEKINELSGNLYLQAFAICDELEESFVQLTEVKMWLGWELNRIKSIQDGTNDTVTVAIPLF